MNEKNIKVIKNILTGFLFVLVIYLMSELASILIPLVLAFLFAGLFMPLINFFNKKKVPRFLFLPIVVIITLGVLFGIVQLFIQTASQIQAQQEFLIFQLNKKFNTVFDWINGILSNNINYELSFEGVTSLLNPDSISNLAKNLAVSIGSFTGSFLMFSLYYIFLLASLANYDKFINYVAGSGNEQFVQSFEKIKDTIISYIGVKTFVSILTGVFAYVILIIFGVKFAFFFAFLTFLLNYIPSIGSTVAVVFPALMGIIQFDSINLILFMVILLTAVQASLGNVVEPILQGRTMKMSPLIIIFGLVFWGYIWGVTGMFLSVPLMVILKIVLEMNPSTRIFARMMEKPQKEPKSAKQ